MRVEVTSVGRAIETTTGDPLFQVTFGNIAQITPEIRQRIQDSGMQVPPGESVGANVVVLFFKFDGPAPYRLGSVWELEVAANGAISLKEVTV
jgi:hypothetical protein